MLSLAFIASSFRVTEENLLFETDLPVWLTALKETHCFIFISRAGNGIVIFFLYPEGITCISIKA